MQYHLDENCDLSLNDSSQCDSEGGIKKQQQQKTDLIIISSSTVVFVKIPWKLLVLC